MEASRVAIFGGSFDPPHMGHAMVTQWVLLTGQADEVWFTPSYSHPLKGRPLSLWKDRVRWAAALAQAVDRQHCLCSLIEEQLPQPSYSIHTLKTLAEEHPDAEFRLLIGSDILAEKCRWHRWADIEERFNPIVADREGFERTRRSPLFPEISSTDIRRRILATGKRSVAHLVPRRVLDLLPEDVNYWRRL